MHPKPICSVPDCANHSLHRGFCSMHYKRVLVHGSPGEAAPRHLLQPKEPQKCAIDDCPDQAMKRDWCLKHYHRWRNHGDAAFSVRLRIYGTVEDRFWPRVDKNGPVPSSRPELGNCWLWTGARDGNGYGRFGHLLAHHIPIGKPPKGLEYDHLCRVPGCVRPEHLEAVTHAENIRRGDAPEAMRQAQLKKTHCPRGHPYDEVNTQLKPGNKRSCRACARAYAYRRYRQLHP